VGVFGEGFEVRDAVVARTDAEDVVESEGVEGGEATGAAATDGQAIAVGETLIDKVEGAVYAVVYVDDAPLTVEAMTVFAPVACAAAIVDVEDGDAATSPELGAEAEGAGGGRGGAAVAENEEGRLLTFGGDEVGVLRRVVEAVGCAAAGGGELDGLGYGDVVGGDLKGARSLEGFDRAGVEIDADEQSVVGGRVCYCDCVAGHGAHLRKGGEGGGEVAQVAGVRVEDGDGPDAEVAVGADYAVGGLEGVGGGAEDPVGDAELGRHGVEGDGFAVLEAVEVPPACLLIDEVEGAVGGPFRLADGFGGAAGHFHAVCDEAMGVEVAEP
jgi:hypothetical protein